MSMCADGDPPASAAAECRGWHEKRLSYRAKDAESFGVPLIISEFGACLGGEGCV